MPDGKIPVYIKIHNQMREWITQEKWQEGEKIPSERQLAKTFDVSRMTARQAVNTLVADGLLERRVGSGTYVSAKKVREKMSGVSSFTETVERSGKKPSSQLISYYVKAPSDSEAEKLKLEPEDKVIVLERVRYADGVPICFEEATIPASIAKGLSKESITKQLYQTLKEQGVLDVSYAEQTISAGWASEAVAEMLNINRGDSILMLRQVTYSQEDVPFEYVRAKYVGERYEFYLRSSK